MGLAEVGIKRIPVERMIRRVYYDLIGLHRRPAQIKRCFVNDRSRPDAYKESDATSAFGVSATSAERWGGIGLECRAFAESSGRGSELRCFPKRLAFLRDYVIDAFNRDLP